MIIKAYGLDIPRTLEDLCDPRRMALLVYDMQVGILSQIKNGAEITTRVLKVLSAARESGIRVVFFRHMSLPKELMGAFQFKMAMAWQRADSPEKVKTIFGRDNPAFQIIPELEPRPSEGIVDKISMSAFEGSYLEMALRDCGIRSFIICGIALEIGIDPTCRQGADLGFWPFLVQDACGFGNEEAAHHSIASLKHMGDTTISDVETICSLMMKSTRPS